MKTRQEQYRPEVRISTLKILERNNFNYLKSSKLTGISRSTIKHWEKQYGAETFSKESPVAKALRQVDVVMKRNDEKILKQYYTIRQQILDRILELIPEEKRLDPLVSTLKNITEEISLIDELDKKEEGTSPLNYFQILTEQLKHMAHEPTED